MSLSQEGTELLARIEERVRSLAAGRPTGVVLSMAAAHLLGEPVTVGGLPCTVERTFEGTFGIELEAVVL